MQDKNGSSIYIRLSTRNIPQLERTLNNSIENEILSGGYWLDKPIEKSYIIILFSGVMAPEVIEAVEIIRQDEINVSVLSITSNDRLYLSLIHI